MKVSSGVAALLGWLLASPLPATWSVLAADRATKEVAIASATCVRGIDLQKRNAVVLVGVGVGNVQAQGDRDGTRRALILHELVNGTTSQRISAIVQAFTEGPGIRQFGFADTGGDSATATSTAADYAAGVTGSTGDLFYAIQGNVLTGPPVVLEAERALVETQGALPERVMAAMLAARSMGGDGRCSCAGGATSCGSPPPSFDKAADVGYLVVSRLGDGDGKRCDGDVTGCAAGKYTLNLNFPFLFPTDPDPVLLMQDAFDAWREAQRGRPDAIKSAAEISASGDGYRMDIALEDWEGQGVDRKVRKVKVQHAPGSARATDIGKVVKIDNAHYRVALTPNGRTGIDRFWITAKSRGGKVVLAPLPRIDDAACAVRVSRTKAGNEDGELAVAVRLKGRGRASQEVGVRITSRLHEPVFATLGTTNRAGKAQGSFVLPSDLYDVHIDSLTPAGGGECFDPDRKRQRIVATDVVIE